MEKAKEIKKWFDNNCDKLKHEVRGAGKDRLQYPDNTLLKSKYHEKLKEYKRTCKSKRYFFWQNKCTDMENSLNDPKIFWKKWKQFSETETTTRKPDINGKDWYDHFANLHSAKDANNESLPLFNIKPKSYISNVPFTKKEFTDAISKLKNNKAEGSDSIGNEMIKNAPCAILDILHNFVNLCLHKSLVPRSWSMGLITPIHKDGSINAPNNYRGICISSALLKIICILLNHRIQEHCNQNELLNQNQIGFKKNHRTADHLLTLKAVVKKYVTIGEKKLFSCFIDFKKAFDSVWHNSLFHKMADYGIINNCLNLIEDIYRKTECAVKIGNKYTNTFKFTKGVRQGCPISPYHFNLFVDEIFDIVNQENDTNIFLEEGKFINALMYADDLIILSETESGLQKQIDKVSAFCEKRKLEINVKKTKIMNFNRGNRLVKRNFTYKSVALENVKTIKYLGFTISAKNCSFLPTIDDLSLRANRALFALNSKYKMSKLPKRLAMKIFNSLITPILLYGSEVWGPFMDYDYLTWKSSKIERVHTQFIKRLLGCCIQTSNIMARGEVGARPLLLDIIKRVIGYTISIMKRPNSTVHSAFTYECENSTNPNFSGYIQKFNLDCPNILEQNKCDITKICCDAYDRFWTEQIRNSSKASSYITFKTTVYFEKYLDLIQNTRFKTSLSRFRLSNHNLMIEKGRHTKPTTDPDLRFCYFCKSLVENEKHFLTFCPLYSPQRIYLENVARENCNRYDSLNREEKFIFLMSNENKDIQNALGKFTSTSMYLRDKLVEYFFI